jgi:hypothetical protein
MRTRTIPILIAVSVALAACGGGDDSAGTTTTAPAEETTTTTTTAAATTPDDVQIGADVHYAGFLLHLDELTVDEDRLALVTGTADNLGSTASLPPSNVSLDLDGEAILLSDLSSELPEVPGDSTGEVAYAFLLPDDAELGAATLLIGGPDYARAEVPLGKLGDLVANDPVEVPVTGDAVAGETTFTFDGGELRFDIPDEHEPAEAGKAYLTLSFAVTNSSSFAGGYAFVGEDLRLETPSGITLAPDEFPIELLDPNASLTDLFARWTIDADEPGTYTFVGLRNVGLPDQAEGRLELEVPALG